MKIDIIDIGFGNINSVKNWLEQLELEVIRVTDAENLKEEMCVLPGVGSAGPYMERLDALGFTEAIKNHVLKGRRLLGICLGFQILFDHSDEDGGTKLLSILQGKVERLVGNQNHNGWENLDIAVNSFKSKGYWGRGGHSSKQFLRGRAFYNHEYAVLNNDQFDYSTPLSSNLMKYTGFLIKDNVAGAQFHPEKSQVFGINFIKGLL